MRRRLIAAAMSGAEAVGIFISGVAAGMVNAAVGSGTLITFPVLLAFGYAPVTANVSNTIGLVPGSLSGALAYRDELRGAARFIIRLAIPSIAGAVTGAALLLALPPGVFKDIVPAFIALALVLVLVGPRLTSMGFAHERRQRHEAALLVALFGCGAYGGYFGAAQGVIVLAVLGLFFGSGLQHVNGLKNVQVMLVNLVAGVAFAIEAHVSWPAAGLIASGSVVGGQFGGRLAKRLPPALFRAAVLGIGTVALVRLVMP